MLFHSVALQIATVTTCCFILKNVTESRSFIPTNSTNEPLWVSSDVDPGRPDRAIMFKPFHTTAWTFLYRVASYPLEVCELGQMWTPPREDCPCVCQLYRCRFFWLPLKRPHPGIIIIKLSKWGSSRLFWKTLTPKSSITRDFLRLRSPLSSFWILVSGRTDVSS